MNITKTSLQNGMGQLAQVLSPLTQAKQKEQDEKNPIAQEGDMITISPIARALYEQSGTNQVPPTAQESAISPTVTESSATDSTQDTQNTLASKTFASGTTVSVYTETNNSDDVMDDLNPYKKVYANIIHADGSSEIMEINSSTVFNEDTNGKFIISQTKAPNPSEMLTFEQMNGGEKTVIQGTDGDDLIINMASTKQSAIYAGEGNNTIISFSSSDIFLGDGDNAVISTFGSTDVVAGNGNNTISGFIGTATLGDGNNTINSNHIQRIKMGDGNNTLNANSVRRISAGNGNNTIDVDTLHNNLQLGHGDNTMKFGNITGNYVGELGLSIGNGNNTIIADTMNNVNNIAFGDGNTTITVDAMKNVREVTFGKGNNTITAGSMENVSGMSFGDGNNAITADNMKHALFMSFGNGNNAITTNTMEDVIGLELGDGDNTLTAGSTTNLSTTFGDGDNALTAGSTNNLSTIFGDGNNTVNIQKTQKHNHIATGDGDNTMTIQEAQNGDTFFAVGNGNSNITISKNNGNSIGVHGNKGNINLQVTGDVHGLSVVNRGDNTVTVDGSVTNARISTRGGKDDFVISGSVLNSYIDFGEGKGIGDNSFTVGEGIYNSYINGIQNELTTNLIFNSIINDKIFSLEDIEDDAEKNTIQERYETLWNSFGSPSSVNGSLTEQFSRFEIDFM